MFKISTHFKGRRKSKRKKANNFNKSTIEKFFDTEELNIYSSRLNVKFWFHI